MELFSWPKNYPGVISTSAVASVAAFASSVAIGVMIIAHILEKHDLGVIIRPDAIGLRIFQRTGWGRRVCGLIRGGVASL